MLKFWKKKPPDTKPAGAAGDSVPPGAPGSDNQPTALPDAFLDRLGEAEALPSAPVERSSS